jgi:hypothetical protein
MLLLRRLNIHIHIVRFHLHHFLWRLILICPGHLLLLLLLLFFHLLRFASIYWRWDSLAALLLLRRRRLSRRVI